MAFVRRRREDNLWRHNLHRTSSRQRTHDSMEEYLRSLPSGDGFGDDPAVATPGATRVVFQNVRGLPDRPTDEKQQVLDNWLQNDNVGAVLLAETNKYWPAVVRGRRWRDRMRRVSPSGFYAISAHNSHQARASVSTHQQGGCAAAVLGKTAHSSRSGGQDPRGLGRWAWIRLQGKNSRCKDNSAFNEELDASQPVSQDVIVVAAYRPCPTHGAYTVWTQQRDYLLEQGLGDDPRDLFITDLLKAIAEWKSWGCEIILGVDLNADVSANSPISFRNRLREEGLNEAILHRHHDPPPATQIDNTRGIPIDGFFTTSKVPTLACGYYGFNEQVESDHRALWLDVDMKTALGGFTPKPIHRARRLTTTNRRTRRRYVKLAEKGYLHYDIPTRLGKVSRELELSGGMMSPLLEKKFNAIQEHILMVRRQAEQGCRKIFRGGKSWSPKSQHLRDRRQLWKLLLQTHSGHPVSSRKLRRLMKKTNEIEAWRLSEADVRKRQKEDNSAYKKVSQTQFLAWRTHHIDTKEKEAAQAARRTWSRHNKERLQTLQRSRQKEEARRRRAARGKGSTGGLRMIQVTQDGDDGKPRTVTCSSQELVEDGCMRENTARYDQTRSPHPTPPMRPPLYQEFTLPLAEDHAKELLNGSWEIPPMLDHPTRSFLAHCRVPRRVPARELHISTQDHTDFWRRMPENKGSEPHGLHNGHYKAACYSPMLRLCDAVSRDIPLQTGVSPVHWRHLMNFAIEKKPGEFRVEKMRTIQLMIAELQANNKFVGKMAMLFGELWNLIPAGQFGSRNKHQSIDLAFAKILVWDLLAIRRQAAGWILNDAKSCFDRVVHWVAQIALLRFGIPWLALHSMFLTLQKATHRVRTGFGDSTTSFSPPSETPFQGCGQGNGAGPTIWVAISSILIDMMASAGHGLEIVSSLSGKLMSAVCFCFVDDSDVVEATLSPDHSSDDLVSNVQAALDLWSGGVRATGGAIQPDKSFWWLIDFQWDQVKGRWLFRRIEDFDPAAALLVLNPFGVRVPLQRLQPNECERSLGVQMSPQFNPKAQQRVLIQKARDWASQVASGDLLPYDVFPLIRSTILKTLGYPMALIHLSISEWERIMSPILMVCLPKAKVCRTFPRAVVYGPLRFQGLGIPHPLGLQLTSQLDMLMRHPVNNTKPASFLAGCIEAHLLETGTEFGIFQQCYANTAILTTDSWIKRVWKDLDARNIHMEFDSPSLPLHRDNDQLLMSVFISDEVDQDELLWLNWCRMYLKVVTVSDISTADGLRISRSAWNGKLPLCPAFNEAQHAWPRSVRPSESRWALWRKCLTRTLLVSSSSKSRRLRHPLGLWHDDLSRWKWLHSSSTNQLFHRQGHGWVALTRPSVNRTRRPNFVMPFCPSFWRQELPSDVQRASTESIVLDRPLPGIPIHDSKYRVQVTGVGSAHPPPTRVGPSILERWNDLRSQISDSVGWVPEIIRVEGDESAILQSLKDGTLRVVSDGSYKNNVGTAASQVVTPDGRHVIWLICQTPGEFHVHSAYRSELIGILAGVMVISWLRENDSLRWNPTDLPTVTAACDGLAALRQSFQTWTLRPHQKQFDLLSTIRTVAHSASVTWQTHHVKGHADDKRPANRLDWWELRNIECDAVARSYRLKLVADGHELASNRRFFEEPATLFIDGIKQTRLNPSKIMELVALPPLLSYWSHRGRIHSPSFAEIDWDVTERMMRNLPSGVQRWLSKHCVGMCGVGKWRQRWNLDIRNECPRCGGPEDAHHVPRCPCPSASAEWQQRLSSVCSWMTKENTAPDIAFAITQLLRSIRRHRSHLLHPTTVASRRPNALSQAVQSQQQIGVQGLLEGLLSKSWAPLQQTYYDRMGFRSSGHRWAARLSVQIVMIGFHLWQHRNSCQHSDANHQLRFRHRDVNLGIKEQFALGRVDLPQQAAQMLSRPRQDILKLPLIDKEQWCKLIRRERARERRTFDRQRSNFYTYTHSVSPPPRPPIPIRRHRGTTRVVRYRQPTLTFAPPPS